MNNLFSCPLPTGKHKDVFRVRASCKDECERLVIEKHYLHRIPSASWWFALERVDSMEIFGAICYGKPASPAPCAGMFGEEHRSLVWELQRVVLEENIPHLASFFTSRTLKMLPSGLGIVSWADSQYGHMGTIYQAMNFLYTGASRPRTDMRPKNGSHPRHYNRGETERVLRSAKHRYVTFTGAEREKRRLRAMLRWPVMSYPKIQELKGQKSNEAE